MRSTDLTRRSLFALPVVLPMAAAAAAFSSVPAGA